MFKDAILLLVTIALYSVFERSNRPNISVVYQKHCPVRTLLVALIDGTSHVMYMVWIKYPHF